MSLKFEQQIVGVSVRGIPTMYGLYIFVFSVFVLFTSQSIMFDIVYHFQIEICCEG